jgi:hypothetical protein
MPYAGDISKFAKFQQYLVGTWSNMALPGGKDGLGGASNPLSYNVMPLPQQAAPTTDPWPYPGYILKNFKYYETIHFNDSGQTTVPIPATAPNRGGGINQIAHALFYDQKVLFAPSPVPNVANTPVHVENGTWITVKTVPQLPGPYPVPSDPTDPSLPEWPGIPRQPLEVMVAKQISVPHGNSVLALGSVDMLKGDSVISAVPPNPLIIPGSPPPYPQPHQIETNRFNRLLDTASDYENPDVELTQNPNGVLQQAVDLIKPDKYIHWRVTTEALAQGKGSVTNIPFEQRRARVTEYFADYWLLHKAGDKTKDGADAFNYLSYTQTMLMEMKIGPAFDERTFLFPHVTCNTVTRK